MPEQAAECRENYRGPREHQTDRGSLALTFSKFSMEDSLGRPMPAAAFTILQSIGTSNGLLVGYLVLAHPEEEGWHGREASVQVERSHLYWCGYPALPPLGCSILFSVEVVQQTLPVPESLESS